jgi:hypothetical protein
MLTNNMTNVHQPETTNNTTDAHQLMSTNNTFKCTLVENKTHGKKIVPFSGGSESYWKENT